jgi:hypothetical protein
VAVITLAVREEMGMGRMDDMTAYEFKAFLVMCHVRDELDDFIVGGDGPSSQWRVLWEQREPFSWTRRP